MFHIVESIIPTNEPKDVMLFQDTQLIVHLFLNVWKTYNRDTALYAALEHYPDMDSNILFSINHMPTSCSYIVTGFFPTYPGVYGCYTVTNAYYATYTELLFYRYLGLAHQDIVTLFI